MRKTDIAREYRTKHPDMPTLKLARIMYAKEGAAFKNVEDCRSFIRAIEGKYSKTAKATHKTPNRPLNPYKLPDSDESTYEPYLLKYSKIAVLSDIHVPYHSISAITAVIDHLKKYKPDCLFINGDLFDFHGLSKYLRDPRKKNFLQEIEIGCELLKAFQRELKCPIYFKLGNHDERYQHYLWMKFGEIVGLEEFELSNIINKRMGKDRVTVIEDKRIVLAGKLPILHGHELVGGASSPVNVARGLFMKTFNVSMCGHHHQVSENTTPTLMGDIVTNWSLGCLCELHPQYMPVNRWAQGFATVDVEKNGHFSVKNYRIHKGKIL